MGHGSRNREHDGKKGPVESIVAGGVFATVFGALWVFRGDWWWVFPCAFAGVLPLVDGVRRLIQSKRLARAASHDLVREREKRVLEAARDRKGRLTPAIVALEANIPLEDAQLELDRLAKQGHASVRITTAGTIEYEFPEFLPETDKALLE